MSAELDEREKRERLEAERDFLLRSLDDLESERAAGAIDDASYAALHDDYTARAAAVIRALRDGIDARPPAPSVPWKRRALVVGGIVVFAVGSAVALASAIGGRGPGETSSGNTRASSQQEGDTAARRRLQRAVERDPSNIPNRLLLARFLEADDDLAGALEQYDEVLRLDATNTDALANSARVLYLAARGAPEEAADLVDEAKARLDQAIELDGEYADARYFRAIVLAYEYQDYAAAQRDLQLYLVLEPDGAYASDARLLLEQVTEALQPRVTTTTN